MIKRKILALALTTITMISVSSFTFAYQPTRDKEQAYNTYGKHFAGGFHKGQIRGKEGVKAGNIAPQKMLDNAKARFQKAVIDGKMTQEQADQEITKLQQRISDIQTFKNMTPEQKKDKLLNDFTARINKQVQDGKITQDKADKAIADYKAKLDKWEGNGFLPLNGKMANQQEKQHKNINRYLHS